LPRTLNITLLQVTNTGPNKPIFLFVLDPWETVTNNWKDLWNYSAIFSLALFLFLHRWRRVNYVKSKAIFVTGRGDWQGFETPRLTHFLDNRLTDGGEVVSLTRQQAALYTPGRFLVLISVRGWVDPRTIVRLEGLDKLKKKHHHRDSNPRTSGL
jgi:hypothetical protein